MEQRALIETDAKPTPLVAAIGLLAVSNVMSNEVLPHDWYVPWNASMALGLTLLAWRWDATPPAAQGWDRDRLRSGLHWGGLAAGLIVASYGVGLALPQTRELFNDDRAPRDLGRLLYQAFVHVPLGTVLLEEVAFRGVLPAMLERRTTPWRAVGISAGLFGLWHVLPSWGLSRANAAVGAQVHGVGGKALTVAAAVVSTAAVGVVFSWLRRRSGSLVAPMLLHLSTNTTGYLFAYGLRRWRS